MDKDLARREAEHQRKEMMLEAERQKLELERQVALH